VNIIGGDYVLDTGSAGCKWRRRRKVNLIKKSVFALLVLSTFFLAFQTHAEAGMKYLGVEVGEPAPDFTLKTLDGRTVQLSSLRGEKVVAIDFWATWCSVCVKELPTIRKYYNQYRDQGFEVLSIVLNPGDVEEIHRVKKENDIDFSILLDIEWKVANTYGLEGPVPVLLVIDAKGIIRFTHFGDFPPGENEIPYVVEELLSELKKVSLIEEEDGAHPSP
jgi:peroxiredoxin